MKKIVMLAVMLLTAFPCFSQITYGKKLEFELSDGYDNEKVFAFGRSGLIMSSRNSKSVDKMTEWKFDLYDIDLGLSKTEKVRIDDKFRLLETYDTRSSLHMYFQNSKAEFVIITVEADGLVIRKTEGLLPRGTRVTDMAILGNYAFFNAVLKKSPFLFSVNMETGKQELYPLRIANISTKKLKVLNFQVLDEASEVFVYIRAAAAKGKTETYALKMNDDGQKQSVMNLSKNLEKNITMVTASKVENNDYVYTGTYSTRSAMMSEGLFFGEGQDNNIEFIKYVNFLDLKNFLSYLPEKKQERIEKKKKKKEAQGQELKINYLIAGHNVVVIPGGYLYLGEAYYPTYRTETYTTTTTVNGVPTTTTQTRQVFDGYQYTHAVLAKFTSDGTLAWDQSFELSPREKPFFVKRFISVAGIEQNTIKLVYASSNRIMAKTFDFDGTVVRNFESEELENNFKGDKTAYTFSNLDFWYDNNFVAFGQQKIVNKEDDNVKKRRKVFFISKISYD